MVDILEGSLRAQRGQQQQEHDSQSATTTGAVEDGSKAAAAGSSSLSLYRRIPEGFPLHLAIIKVFNVRTQSYCDVIGHHLMNDIMEGVRARTVNYSTSNGIFGITWSLNTHDALQRIDHLTSHR
ncbi:hypothetical protein FOZ63_016152 [Perkinsus olseni]|uniref:Uncharacterized protein n=1 Tax=Perkinsus olseni TaxID=32597 RepID=A0A7J6SIK7_PEROL|nr:hypothetical protein FOZ63_016152 [Perkinsus olseni]